MIKKVTKTAFHNAKKKVILVTAGLIFLSFISWMVYNSTRSYPLGEKLEYIGKMSGGSYYPLSASKPYTDYYYATDASPEEITKSYFKDARLTESLHNGQDGWYEIKTDKGVVTITIKKRIDVNLAIVQPISKKYILTISDYEYDALRSSL